MYCPSPRLGPVFSPHVIEDYIVGREGAYTQCQLHLHWVEVSLVR